MGRLPYNRPYKRRKSRTLFQKWKSLWRSVSSDKKALGHLDQDVILDGEVVVVNEEGVPSFQALQHYDALTTAGELRYYVFDMLYLNGHEMLSLPLTDRKSLIPEVIEGLDSIYYCDHVEGMGKSFYTRAIDAGLEGVIAKKG